VRRVVVVGNSGSGKSTLAAALAERLGVPHVELDALHHGPGWTPTPIPQFREAAHRALDEADAAAGGWTICGNYAQLTTGIWARADTVVWIDLPRAVVMGRVLRRTTSRVVRRVELWNGNRESLSMVLALHDPERSIIRWAWDGVERNRRRYVPAMASDTWADLRWHHLRSPAEVRAWLAAVPQT
jgi:adenylate kinase family enzyme